MYCEVLGSVVGAELVVPTINRYNGLVAVCNIRNFKYDFISFNRLVVVGFAVNFNSDYVFNAIWYCDSDYCSVVDIDWFSDKD